MTWFPSGCVQNSTQSHFLSIKKNKKTSIEFMQIWKGAKWNMSLCGHANNVSGGSHVEALWLHLGQMYIHLQMICLERKPDSLLCKRSWICTALIGWSSGYGACLPSLIRSAFSTDWLACLSITKHLSNFSKRRTSVKIGKSGERREWKERKERV